MCIYAFVSYDEVVRSRWSKQHQAPELVKIYVWILVRCISAERGVVSWDRKNNIFLCVLYNMSS